jgi:hypothetical protein
MILIAVIAMVATAMRSSTVRRDPFAVLLLLSIPPATLMTGIRAEWRRSRGLRMSGWERVISLIQLTVGLALLFFLVLLIIYSH